jgi:hypothetical protein
MENIVVTKSLKRQLNLVVLHEQVENGITISNNFNVDQVDQRFETLKKSFLDRIETSVDRKET